MEVDIVEVLKSVPLSGGEKSHNEKMERKEDLKAFAGKACIDIYLSLHVSEMKDKSEPIKKAWSIGQELYTSTENLHCNHNWVTGDNEVIKGLLICTICNKLKVT